MPARDMTGPQGKGPKTGRQLGNCKVTNNDTVRSIRIPGRGRGLGLGRGSTRRGNMRKIRFGFAD